MLFGKVTFSAPAGAVASDGYSSFSGLEHVTKVNPSSTTGKYRLEFADKYMDLVGFWGSTSGTTNGDGYDIVLIDEHVHGSGAASPADAYEDGYAHIQFFQGGTPRDPVSTTAYLCFVMKTSSQG
jgi:hypothetical protein